MKDLLECVRKNRFLTSFLTFYKSAELEFTSIAVAYYLMISIFPILLIAANLLPYLHLDLTDFLDLLESILPVSLYATVADMVKITFSRPSTSLLSLSILSALWTFSSSMTLLQKAFNKAYGVDQGRGLVWERLLSFLLSLGLQFIMALSIFLVLFGRSLLQFLHRFWDFNQEVYHFLLDKTEPWIYLTLFLALSMLYFFLPNVKIRKVGYVLPGATFTLVVFLSLSNLFGLYVSHSMTKLADFRIVGSVLIFAMMLWFIFFSQLLIIGAVINASYQSCYEVEFQSRNGHLLLLFQK